MNLEEFYDDHVEKVYKFFYFKSLHKHVAEDLTQETWLRFVEKDIETIEETTKFLYGVMRNVWLEFLRHKYSALVSDIETADDFEQYVYAENLIYSSDDLPERAKAYINLLPDKQKTVFDLRFLQGLNVKQSAEALGKDKNYIKVTYKRALTTLRQIIKEPYLYKEGATEEV